jgi:hypothetical protein
LNTPNVIEKNAKYAGFKIKELHLHQGPADSVMLGPLMILELIWMKLLSFGRMKKFQSNIIALLEK